MMENVMYEILSLLPVFMDTPVDDKQETFYFNSLSIDYPEVDILQSLKDFFVWILDNPDKYDKQHPSFHRRFRKWCERAGEYKLQSGFGPDSQGIRDTFGSFSEKGGHHV